MKNDTIKITDKVVMARYISGVSSSQKDQDGIFAEAEQIYDHGFTYFNVDKENNKAIFVPETKTDGLDQSTINWALKKGIVNISRALGDLDQTVDGIRHELSTIPGGVSSYLEKINRNTSAINTLQTAVGRLEESDHDYYFRIQDLENRISQSGLALYNINTITFSGEQEEEITSPSNYFRVWPTKFVGGEPSLFWVYPISRYKFNDEDDWDAGDAAKVVYSINGNDVSESYKWINVSKTGAYLWFETAPTQHIEIRYPGIEQYNPIMGMDFSLACEIPHVTLSKYGFVKYELNGSSVAKFYAYCEDGYKFNINTFKIIGKYHNKKENPAVYTVEFNDDGTVLEVTLNYRERYRGSAAFSYKCIGSVLPVDEDEPVVNHTVTLNLSNVSDINISNERTSQTPKTKTLTYTVASNSTLTVPLYKYSNTSDFNYAIDGNPTGGPNHAPNVIVNDSNFYYEEVEGVLVLHITSIWGDCTFDISANYVDDSTIPSQPTDEDDNPVTTPTLQVSPSQITLSYDDFEPRVITVTSNSNFTIK